ncbi:hypothetical protein J5N97_020758 [Dioscorea zingiberensis]|uniref:Uncharacterized protein n=1 Tax=Dioscorea zingiberensis TaxID=325984 RepID=A0A9D5HDQ8_9LILI|nr:hypothetical protein J5N97_020758 [Dioscorea zingiberensis]
MSFDHKKRRMESSCVPMALLFLLGMLLSSPSLARPDHDFYFLVLLWPGTYCSQSKCCRPTTGNPADDFLIRGLWPVDAATESVLTRCSKEPFIKKELEGLEDELALHWSNLKCPSNNGMAAWRSTWKTYGTCSNKTETNYFEDALDLRNEVDVLNALEKQGIIPNGIPYPYTSIVGAIEKKIGVKPMIRCNSKDELYEVYICVDKHANFPIECPFDMHFTCNPSIFFPVFDANKLKSEDLIKMPISVE